MKKKYKREKVIMKDMILTLKELYPNNLVSIKHKYEYNSQSGELYIEEYYKCYIDGEKILGEFHWSNKFNTLLQLHKYLCNVIPRYKEIYYTNHKK